MITIEKPTKKRDITWKPRYKLLEKPLTIRQADIDREYCSVISCVHYRNCISAISPFLADRFELHGVVPKTFSGCNKYNC